MTIRCRAINSFRTHTNLHDNIRSHPNIRTSDTRRNPARNYDVLRVYHLCVRRRWAKVKRVRVSQVRVDRKALASMKIGDCDRERARGEVFMGFSPRRRGWCALRDDFYCLRSGEKSPVRVAYNMFRLSPHISESVSVHCEHLW